VSPTVVGAGRSRKSVPGKLSQPSRTIRRMSRRADAERIHAARRAATLARLIGDGRLPERVEALIARWEAMAAAEDRPHDGAYWEAFEAWRQQQPPDRDQPPAGHETLTQNPLTPSGG
jgi:hypothetical protein